MWQKLCNLDQTVNFSFKWDQGGKGDKGMEGIKGAKGTKGAKGAKGTKEKGGEGTKGRRAKGDEGAYRSHWTLQEPVFFPFVVAQIFAVFFTIAKNSAYISENVCANIYENICGAKKAQQIAHR